MRVGKILIFRKKRKRETNKTIEKQETARKIKDKTAKLSRLKPNQKDQKKQNETRERSGSQKE
jgi:hypothetical protein